MMATENYLYWTLDSSVRLTLQKSQRRRYLPITSPNVCPTLLDIGRSVLTQVNISLFQDGQKCGFIKPSLFEAVNEFNYSCVDVLSIIVDLPSYIQQHKGMKPS
ncbi:hypothetical protein KA344_14380 [bacterium]|nr:hypothetical protein [bacterium]